MDKVEISGIFGCGENERQSSEFLNDIAPIALNQIGIAEKNYICYVITRPRKCPPTVWSDVA